MLREREAGNREGKRRGGVDRGDDTGQNFKETSERLWACASGTAPFCDNRGAKQLIPLEMPKGEGQDPGTSEYLIKEVFNSAFDITQSG